MRQHVTAPTPIHCPFTKGGKTDPANMRAVVAPVCNVSRDNLLYTDESRHYTKGGAEFAGHETVKHSKGEYVHGMAHSNTVENVFSVFKRGKNGVYQHCGEAHRFRYLAEFDFRYNHRAGLGITNAERAIQIVKQIGGKRLTYRRTGEAAHA